jgi:hypothetical protein
MALRNKRSALWLALSGGSLALGLLAVPGTASAGRLRIRSDFGPENARRALRPETRYIVLHTTEGREAGSLRKLRTRGEAHYFVRRDGRVVRLLDRSRIATHAGRSLWDGRSEIDEMSLGIEVSGYHDRGPTRAQSAALRELLRQLQSVYRIPDEDVLTHSMVAYGSPNRYHPYRHRGRKRCAMAFARPDVRRELGLSAAPRDDPDVRAGRLRVGDPELQRVLYPAPATATTRRAAAQPDPPPRTAVTAAAVEPAVAHGDDTITLARTAWSIAGRAYASATTLYVFPDGTRATGDAIRGWDSIPPGTRVVLDDAGVQETPLETEAEDPPQYEDGLILVSQATAARDLLGSAAGASTTTYIFTDGSVRTGSELERDAQGRRRLRRLPPGTRILVGYVSAGRLTSGRSLARVAGNRWNYPSTYYRLPNGRIRAGVEIEDSRLPEGTLVFFRR